MGGNSQLVSWWPVLCVRARYCSSEACDVSICVTIPPATAMLSHGCCCTGFPTALRRALKDAGGAEHDRPPGDDVVLGKGQQELPAHQVRGVCIGEN